MEFLKEILGDELFAQFTEKVNAHNGDEANKEKQIKIGNLGSGEYVGKGKYDALNEMLNGKQTELDTANGLIAELKKTAKGNEALEGKISEYERTIATLQAQNAEIRTKAALKFALMEAKALDIPYMTFNVQEKLRQDGKTLELDENDNIKGWEDMLSALKTQYPAHFETATKGREIVGDNKLPESDKRPPVVTKEDFNKMGYNSRVKLKETNPELYSQLTN